MNEFDNLINESARKLTDNELKDIDDFIENLATMNMRNLSIMFNQIKDKIKEVGKNER